MSMEFYSSNKHQSSLQTKYSYLESMLDLQKLDATEEIYRKLLASAGIS